MQLKMTLCKHRDTDRLLKLVEPPGSKHEDIITLGGVNAGMSAKIYIPLISLHVN
ncbi:hypothetical protein IF2G_03536 [Cordyceps javanica]|nr:hypothetical protein IF2G_03536 [Cordyceps javanica]